MVTLCVDPGTVSSGVSFRHGETRYSWTVKARANHPLDLRLRIIRRELSKIFTTVAQAHGTDVLVVIEDGIYRARPKVCSMIGEVRGIVMAEAWRRGWALRRIAPVTWKRLLSAEERKMEKGRRYVEYWNGKLIVEASSPDEVDALLIDRYVDSMESK